MAKTMVLNCPTCGPERPMKAIKKMKHSKSSIDLLYIGTFFCFIIGFFFFPLWILGTLLFLGAISLGLGSNKYWKCQNCGALLLRD